MLIYPVIIRHQHGAETRNPDLLIGANLRGIHDETVTYHRNPVSVVIGKHTGLLNTNSAGDM